MSNTAAMTLGKTLKGARENIPLTLRQVEDITGISNPYLSLLENDKIKKPSASVLYKLAAAYKIELNSLLMAAGIIQYKEEAPMPEINSAAFSFYAENLKDEDKAKALDFMKYLFHKK